MSSYTPPNRYTPREGEILSPEANYAPPQSARQPRPSWRVAPATYLLIAINCAVFLAMVLNGVSAMSPTTGQLMHFGADRAGEVLLAGQWWRIVTAMFVHVGLIHLATNMWCLWNLGMLAEPLLGSAGVVGVYILTGAAGNLLSTAVNWYFYSSGLHMYGMGAFPAGAGASGAVFGIAGALIVLLKSPRLPVPPDELKKLRRSVIYFAAINLIIGFSLLGGNIAFHAGPSIDNMAHLGGFGCGLLFAAPLVPRIGSPRGLFRTRLKLATAMVVAVLVLFGFYITKFAG
jgi:rhomboid protease GluP